MSSMYLGKIEALKILYAGKLFDELGRHITQDDVKYAAVSDYDELMEIVRPYQRCITKMDCICQ